MRLAVLLLWIHAEVQAQDSLCENDASPLLQMVRHNTSSNSSNLLPRVVHGSPALRALSRTAHAPAVTKQNASSTDRKLMGQSANAEDSSLPFFGPTPFPRNGTIDGKAITRRMREKQLGREAVSAAALIMVLISFSVGLQLIMVEFVMTGSCAIPRNVAGVFLAMIYTITMGLRCLVRLLTAPLRPPCRFLWQCCCTWRLYKGSSSPAVTQTLPEPVLQQVVTFLSLDGMCDFGCASKACRDLVNSDGCYTGLLAEVASSGLEHRWQRHLQRVKAVICETDTGSGTEKEEPCKTEKDKGSPAPMGDWKVSQNLIKELRTFLCRQVRRSKAKAEAKEVNERWNVVTDVVRYCMLVIGWFWFSAEVMDMACLEGGGPWQVVKAISSPCLFIFILESDRNHFWWQVIAGLVASALLVDLLFG